jgi:hypothetical protein
MSFAKRMLEHQEAQRTKGTDLAVAAGVLEVCEYHGIAFESGSEAEEAYKLGNAKFSAGEFSGIFETRREMTDAIKEAIDDAPVECYECERAFGDD